MLNFGKAKEMENALFSKVVINIDDCADPQWKCPEPLYR